MYIDKNILSHTLNQSLDENAELNSLLSKKYSLFESTTQIFENNAEYCVRDLRNMPNKIADFWLRSQVPTPGCYSILFNMNNDGKSLSLYRFVSDISIEDQNANGINVVIPHKIGCFPIKRIAHKSFIECHNVTSIVIPNTVKSIGPRAFEYCDSLEKIYLPNTIKEIKHHTFARCNSLRGMVLPNSVTKIGDFAFSECKELQMIILPDSLKNIGHFVFFNCKRLKHINIPNSVSNIGDSAFYGCDNIKININEANSIRWDKPIENKRIYDRFVANLFASNAITPEDPDNIKHSLDLMYSVICSEFNKNFDLNNNLNDLLLQIINADDDLFLSLNYNFLKYIHIYNFADTNNNAKINLYIDFTNKVITNDKSQIKEYEKNIIYSDLSLTDFILEDKGIISDGILEFAKNATKVILNPLYNPIIITTGKKNKKQFTFSPFLTNYYMPTKFPQLPIYKDIQYFLRMLEKLFTTTNSYYFASVHGSDTLNKGYTLYANVGIDNEDVDNECIKVFIREFKKFIDYLSFRIITGINDYNKKEQAISPAISVVMNRNLRHNYGSHVLSYLCGDGIYEKLSDNVIKNTLTNYISDEDSRVFNEGKNNQLPYFIRYLKNRIDYISEITLDSSNILTTRFIYKDVILGIDRVRILLNYISGVSNFKYKFKTLYNGRQLSSDNDIAAAFPNDIIGICAIWNICENIVRNTSKHAKINAQQEIAITLDFSDCKECPGYYKVEIDNGVLEDSMDELVENMNIKINDSVLDKDSFELRDKNLGLVEMSVAAAYLRSLDLSCIDSYEYRFDKGQELYNDRGNLIIFKAINKNGALGYRFFIQKPKEFLFVGDWNISTDKQKNMLNHGITFIREKEFVESMDKNISFPHRFLIYQDNISFTTMSLLADDNDCKTLLPIRKLHVASNEANEITKTINDDNNNIVELLNEYAWSHYYKNSNNVIIGTLDPDKISDYDQLVFLSHATNKNLCDIMKLKTDNHQLFVENFSSYTESKLPRFAELSILNDGKKEKPLTSYWKNIINNKQIKSEIIEAYREKVLVIDERIQKFSLTNTEGSSSFNSGPIPCSSLFASTNVLIPNAQLDPIDFNEELIKEIEHFINENISDSFLLIHYGILERIYKNTQIITDKLVDWSYKAKRIVVTSGRGSHSLPLPPSVCYANLSSVLSVFIYNRNKFLINNLLYQSRRKHE